VAALIVEMLGGGNGWTGTAKELLTQVDNRASDQQKRGKNWPKTPHAMASRLRRVSEILRVQGWRVEAARATTSDRARIITIVPDKTGEQSSETSNRPKSNAFNNLELDDCDPPVVRHRPIVRTSSSGNPLKQLGFGLDDPNPSLSGNECAFCGKADPPPRTCSWGGDAVPLHADCEEYWAREHEADDVPL
jgi:hypothetical protein